MYNDYNKRYDPLCCCEYLDRNDQRNHILACLCNCIDLDEGFENLVSGRLVSDNQKTEMYLTFQDRVRIPWKGGAKRIAFDSILPIVLLPVLLFVAAVSVMFSVIVFIGIPVLLFYCRHKFQSIIPRTKFFFIWTIWSGIYLLILFESVVPLFELLPEENFLFLTLLTASIFCFFKVKQNATLNYIEANVNVEESTIKDDTVLLISETETDGNNYTTCQNCYKNSSLLKTTHCLICQACIVKQDHHNFWLDCCIGPKNRRFFFVGCILSIFTLLLNADLSLTAICRPYVVGELFTIIFILPDDCSEVYDEYDIAIGFVGSVYSLLLAVFFLYMLIRQVCVISRGGPYKRRGNIDNHKNYCIKNWQTFFCVCDYLPF